MKNRIEHCEVLPVRSDWLFQAVQEFQRLATNAIDGTIEERLATLVERIAPTKTALEELLLRGLFGMARAAQSFQRESNDRTRVPLPLVDRAQHLIHEHFAEPLSYGVIGDRLGCDPEYLESLFRQVIGETLHGYVRRLRVEHAMLLIQRGEKVEVAAWEVGFRSKSGLSRALRSLTGKRPSELRKL